MAAPTENNAAVALATDAPMVSDAVSAWTFEELLAAEPVALAARLAREEAAAPIAGWSDEQAAALVTKLKDGADRHWLINPNRSLEMADAILRIGRTRGDTRTTALGIMARADAMKLLGHSQEAWDAFQEAGRLFQEAGDEVGWARTRIGPLFLSVKINRVDEALADGKTARAILEAHGEDNLLVRLNFNAAYVCYERGDHDEALRLYEAARITAELRSIGARQFLGLIYTNIGLVYCDLLGDYVTAAAYFERARTFAAAQAETKNVALAEHNLAVVRMAQGDYRQALSLLFAARERYQQERLPLDANHVDRLIVECYVLLNRFAEARELALRVVKNYREFGAAYDEADALLHLATAQAGLDDLEGADRTLSAAEELFRSLGGPFRTATAQLRRGRLALKRGDADAAQIASASVLAFSSAGEYAILHAHAMLLRAQVSLVRDSIEGVADIAATVLKQARAHADPLLRYEAHLLLGDVAWRKGTAIRAARHYQSAVATVDRVQRRLTITLRPDFLEDKSEALRSLTRVHLNQKQWVRAFETIERAKSQALFEIAAGSTQQRWSTQDERSVRLQQEFQSLRDRHHWLYAQAHDEMPHDANRAVDRSDMLQQLLQCERRMRQVTEQLYIVGNQGVVSSRRQHHGWHEVRQHLHTDELLVEFYMDSDALHAFTCDEERLEAHVLPSAPDNVQRLIAQLQLNIATTLRQDAHSAAARVLHASASRLLEQLFAALLEPLASALRGRRRLYIVPYGILHYLPFHLLRANGRYLIEDYEVVILPSAGLLTRSAPGRNSGARIVAHSANGALPQVLAEAEIVESLFSGDVRREEAANRGAFEAPPTQILHVAAHAAFRLDQPDLSYIELADGQLYADDLMQQDLSYELVTLSACETGRAHVAPRDELIGLGRGFLYAGAGSLIASLWRVADDIALSLMRSMYEALRAGASKAAALRSAQRAILAEDPNLHPAYWGPFQLTGDAGPLSSPRHDIRGGMLREEVMAR